MSTPAKGAGRGGVPPPKNFRFRSGDDPRRYQAKARDTTKAIIANCMNGFVRHRVKTPKLIEIVEDETHPHAERVAARILLLVLGLDVQHRLTWTQAEQSYLDQFQADLLEAGRAVKAPLNELHRRAPFSSRQPLRVAVVEDLATAERAVNSTSALFYRVETHIRRVWTGISPRITKGAVFPSLLTHLHGFSEGFGVQKCWLSLRHGEPGPAVIHGIP